LTAFYLFQHKKLFYQSKAFFDSSNFVADKMLLLSFKGAFFAKKDPCAGIKIIPLSLCQGGFYQESFTD